jgi:hypothetical protein
MLISTEDARRISYVHASLGLSSLAWYSGEADQIQIFTLIAMGANIGSGYAPGYAQQIVCRCFVGVGASVALAIGGATVSSSAVP